MISVVLADDRELVREGLRMMLEADDDVQVVDEAETGRRALELSRRDDPDVLMDVRMPEMAASRRRAGRRTPAPTRACTQRLIEDFCKRPPPSAGLPPSAAGLTERELEVLRLIARGKSNAEIAAELVLGGTTVKSHVARLLAKLGLGDRVQAVVFAYDSGVARPGDADHAPMP